MMVSVSLSFQLLVEQTLLGILNRFLHLKPSELPIYWLLQNCEYKPSEVSSQVKHHGLEIREVAEKTQ